MKQCKCARRNSVHPSAKGYTLTELVITIAVIALLISFAIPSYMDFMVKSRRTEAKELLYTAAQRQQQYFTMNNEYATTASALSVPATSSNGYYNLSITVTSVGGTNNRYTLTATPASGSSQTKDTRCGTYSLNSLGTKTVSGSQTTPPCW